MGLRKAYYLLPPAARMLARKIYYLPMDLLYPFSEVRKLRPPMGEIYTGGGDFIKTGQRFVSFFVEYGNLAIDDTVLDIGSGIGRMALPLTNYLSSDAKYNGYDVVKKGVDWCQKNITRDFPHFAFHYIPLYNDLYKNDGDATVDFNFPLEDQSQGFIFLISVMTHLTKKDMEHYITEISRLLEKEKRCFVTYFIHDNGHKEVNSNFNFQHQFDDYSLMDIKVPSANVAYKKEYLFDFIKSHGLTIEQYHPGYWRDPKLESSSLDFQDILVLQKS